MQGKAIMDVFETLYYACEHIRDCDLCHECPMRNFCLEDPEMSVNDYVDMPASAWDEFFDYSEHAEASAASRTADYADWMRKMAIEERIIDDEYGR